MKKKVKTMKIHNTPKSGILAILRVSKQKALHIALLALLIFSCDLFQPNNPDYWQELQDEVTYANAPYAQVSIGIISGSLSAAPTEAPREKVGYPFSVQATANAGYGFVGWRVLSKDDWDSLDQSSAAFELDFIDASYAGNNALAEISDMLDVSGRPSGRAEITVLTEDPIVIVPYATMQPALSSASYPAMNAQSVPYASRIELRFDAAVTEESFRWQTWETPAFEGDIKNISISAVSALGVHYTPEQLEPLFDFEDEPLRVTADGKLLQLRLNQSRIGAPVSLDVFEGLKITIALGTEIERLGAEGIKIMPRQELVFTTTTNIIVVNTRLNSLTVTVDGNVHDFSSNVASEFDFTIPAVYAADTVSVAATAFQPGAVNVNVSGAVSTLSTDTELSGGRSTITITVTQADGGGGQSIYRININNYPAITAATVSLTPTTGQLNASWTPVEGASGYWVYYNLTNDQVSAQRLANVVEGTTAAITGAPGSTLFEWVQAVAGTDDARLNSPTFSTSASARILGSNNTLSQLSVATYNITPSFFSNTENYDLLEDVPNSTTNLTVNFMRGDIGQTVVWRMNGGGTSANVTENSFTATGITNIGLNTLTIVVTPADGSTSKTYTILIYKRPATTAWAATPLGDLTGDNVQVNWSNTGVTGHSGFEVYRSTINIAGSGGSALNVTSTTATSTIVDGIMASSAYYFWVRSYTTVGARTVYSEWSDSPQTLNTAFTLQTLSVATYTVTPSFFSNTENYDLFEDVPNSTTSVTVNFTRGDAGQTIVWRMNGGGTSENVTGTSFTATGINNIGLNTLTILVTPAGGTTSKTYTVRIYKKPATPAWAATPLSNFTENNVTVNWSNTGVTGHNGFEVYRSTIATAGSGGMVFDVNSTTAASRSIDVAANNFYYFWVRSYTTAGARTVYSEWSASHQTLSTAFTLQTLNVNTYTMTPSFFSNTEDYELLQDVPNNTTSVTVNFTRGDTGQTVTWRMNDGEASANVTGNPFTATGITNIGLNTLYITVTPAGSSASKTYTIRIYKRPATPAWVGDTSTSSLGEFTGSDVIVNWDNSGVTGHSGFEVYRSTINTAGSGGLAFNETSPTATSTIVGGILANSAYYFWVRSYTTEDARTVYSEWSASPQTLNTAFTLQTLSVDSYTMTPSFFSNTEDYDLLEDVPNSTTSVTVNFTRGDPGQTVVWRMNGGGTSANVTGNSFNAGITNIGLNTLTITVTPAGGSTSKTYTIRIYKRPAVPTWAAAPLSGISQTIVHVNWDSTGVAGHSGFEVYRGTNPDAQIGGMAFDVDSSTVTSREIPIATNNLYYFWVRSYTNAGTRKIYSDWSTSSITLSTVSTLQALSVTGSTMTPSFFSNTTNYTLLEDVPNNVNSVTVNLELGADGQTVVWRMNTGAVSANVTGNFFTATGITNIGLNTLYIMVTPAGSSVTNTYSINIYKKPATPAWAATPLNISTESNITVNWSNTGVTGHSGFEVYRGTIATAGSGGMAFNAASGITSMSIDVAANNFYYFWVRSYTTAGARTVYSDWSASPQTLSTAFTLQALSVTGNTMTPSFFSNTGDYELLQDIPNNATSVTVNFTRSDAGQTVTWRMNSGTNSANIAGTEFTATGINNIGLNTLYITVTPAGGTISKVYTISIYKKPATPAWADEPLSDISQTNVVVNWSNNGVTGHSGFEVYRSTSTTAGSGGVALNASSGATSMTVEIAANTSYNFWVRSYKTEGARTVYSDWSTSPQTLSTAFTLQTLSVDSYTISPSFFPNTEDYELLQDIPNNATSVTVNFTRNDPGQQVVWRMNGGGTSNVTGNSFTADISNIGRNTLNILVTPAGGSTTKTYTIYIYKKPAAPTWADAPLSGISQTIVHVNWDSTGVTGHSGFEVYRGTNPDAQIGGMAFDVDSSTETSKEVSIAANNLYYFWVRSYSTTVGARTVYSDWSASSVTLSTVSTLQALSVTGNTMTPLFFSNTTNYDLLQDVPNDVDSVTVNFTRGADGQTVVWRMNTGATSANVTGNSFTATDITNIGLNTLTIMVTPAGSSVTNTYSINIYKRPATPTWADTPLSNFSEGSVQVNWMLSGVTGHSGVEVYRSTISTAGSGGLAVDAPSSTATSTIVGDLLPNNSYFFWVRSYKNEGTRKVYSQWSASPQTLSTSVTLSTFSIKDITADVDYPAGGATEFLLELDYAPTHSLAVTANPASSAAKAEIIAGDDTISFSGTTGTINWDEANSTSFSVKVTSQHPSYTQDYTVTATRPVIVQLSGTVTVTKPSDRVINLVTVTARKGSHTGTDIIGMATATVTTGSLESGASAVCSWTINALSSDVVGETSVYWTVSIFDTDGYMYTSQSTSNHSPITSAGLSGVSRSIAIYSVTAPTTSGGTISAQRPAYQQGEIVTLTSMPAQNYIFSGTPQVSPSVSLTQSGNNFNFPMPANNVTVTLAASGATNRFLCTDATLSGLELSNLSSDLVFSSFTTNYTVSTNAVGTESTTVTPTKNNPGTITVNGAATTSGTGRTITTNTGRNTIAVVVTPESGSPVTYNITVNRSPAAPVGAITLEAGYDRVTASWTAVPNADRYEIEYSTSPVFATVTNLAASGTSFPIMNLEQGRRYYVRVRASKDYVSGEYTSNIIGSVPGLAENYTELKAMTTQVSAGGTIYLSSSGTFDVDSALTIVNGKNITLIPHNGINPDRGTVTLKRANGYNGVLINVEAGGRLNLRNTKTSGGTLIIDGGAVPTFTTVNVEGTNVNYMSGINEDTSLTAINPAVEVGGTMTIYDGVFIQNNYNSAAWSSTSGTGGGGGVSIWSGGSFTMEGGTIRQNYAYIGGGVIVNAGNGTNTTSFTMKGGEIKTNFAAQQGGGVTSRACILELSDGEISYNYIGSTSVNNGSGWNFMDAFYTFTQFNESFITNNIKSNLSTDIQVNSRVPGLVTTATQLNALISQIPESGTIYLQGSIMIDRRDYIITIPNGKTITLIPHENSTPDSPAELYRYPNYRDELINVNAGGTLKLRGNNNTGETLLIDGRVNSLSGGSADWKPDDDGYMKGSTLPTVGGYMASRALVHIYGTMNMYDGVSIQNNYNDMSFNPPGQGGGGGVTIFGGGTFNMAGGIIQKNCAAYGGGVMINFNDGPSGATFTMTGGEIKNNLAYIRRYGATTENKGGGVYSRTCTATVTGGSITYNSVEWDDATIGSGWHAEVTSDTDLGGVNKDFITKNRNAARPDDTLQVNAGW